MSNQTDLVALSQGNATGLTPLAGSVVQKYLWYVPQGQISAAASPYTDAPTAANTTAYTSHTVTPQRPNSTFIFEMSAPVDSNTASGYGEFVCLFQGSTLLAVSYWYRRVAGSETQMHSFRGSYTHSGSDAFDVTIRVKSSNSQTLSFNRQNGYLSTDKSAYLAVTEIAQ